MKETEYWHRMIADYEKAILSQQVIAEITPYGHVLRDANHEIAQLHRLIAEAQDALAAQAAQEKIQAR